MGNEYYLNYETLETGANFYQNQSVAITDIMSALSRMNLQLEEGWQNETARAFIEKYEREYAPSLKRMAEDLENISMYILRYSQNRREEDSSGAAGLR